MKEYLKYLEIEFNKSKLLSEALDTKNYDFFVDPLTGSEISSWQIKKITDGYGMEIANKFQTKFNLSDCRPRFYIQKANTIIPFHKDRGTLCSINILLSNKLAPISFRDITLYYNSALLNTQVDHAVYNESDCRILYKISIFDKSYQEMYDVLPHKIFL